MRILRGFVVTIASLGAIATHLPAHARQGPPPAAVRVDAVRMEKVQEQRLVTGDLRTVQRSRVAGQEGGLVLDVPVEQGQVVKKGEALARLDSTRLEIELLEVEADRQVALADVLEKQADLEWKQRDLENYQSLSAGGAGRAKELYDAQMQVRIAEAKVESLKRTVDAIAARAELLRQRVADATIVAPFDGVIVSKHSEEGEWLAAGAPVVEMLSTGTVDAWLDVPQQFADAVLGKQPLVTINVEATGTRIETSNIRIVPQVDPKARTFAIVARLDNIDGLLAPGMSVTAFVPTGDEAERLTISRDAIMRTPTGAMVYVARQTDPKAPPSAMPADVQVMFAWGARMVVQSPMLQPGDMLVVEGNERLFPTAPIIPQPVGTETPKRESAETPKATTGSASRESARESSHPG